MVLKRSSVCHSIVWSSQQSQHAKRSLRPFYVNPNWDWQSGFLSLSFQTILTSSIFAFVCHLLFACFYLYNWTMSVLFLLFLFKYEPQNYFLNLCLLFSDILLLFVSLSLFLFHCLFFPWTVIIFLSETPFIWLHVTETLEPPDIVHAHTYPFVYPF